MLKLQSDSSRPQPKWGNMQLHRLSADELAQQRKEHLEGEHRELFATIGLFVFWYTAAEFQITRLLAHALNPADFEKAEKRIGKKTKLKKKLKWLQKLPEYNKALSPNLDTRIEFFKTNCASLRHGVAHDLKILVGRTVSFTSVGRMTTEFDSPARPRNLRPMSHDLDDIFTHAVWLRDFAMDLNDAATCQYYGHGVEIINPRSQLKVANR